MSSAAMKGPIHSVYKPRMRLPVILLIPFLLLAEGTGAAPESRPCVAATAASRAFLRDFENLDWTNFRRWFADDATIFFPIPEPPHRFSGRAEFEAQWTKVFAAIRSGSASKSPPFHRLPVHDFRCDPLGSDAALISFTLDNSERTGRRTLVWHRSAGRWRIVHLHASNTPK